MRCDDPVSNAEQADGIDAKIAALRTASKARPGAGGNPLRGEGDISRPEDGSDTGGQGSMDRSWA